ncbi:monovalent cation/H+ antiporter subunit A [Lysobacter pythonis]|uniref:Monovalent cation/H+ antiporter subunit A n=1 Tax=Solilutibacter pythonis TaxID=2483112 RepID=A0A3M2HUI6_9GAMM|nr:monovalent cation/H+ antiporter subunit A [Lysobacter pythonis]RMH93371.1 monovalent cation/H+ antiporter subunit A [Lysobacter pythonis]
MLGLILLLPFAASALIPLLGGSRRQSAWLAGLAPLTGLAILAMLTPAVMAGQVPELDWAWLPEAGIGFILRLDGLAWMFALMVLSIGALVVLYAAYYLGPRDSVPRFFSYLMLFMGAMLGLVLSGDLLLMVVFWELTSISSFLLIGYWNQRRDARQGARMALTVTGLGGMALLGGVLLIGQAVGSYRLEDVLAAGDVVRASPWYPAILGLVLLGAFTKSAQFPFHFWLPQAMAAPTPVSAYLHSATMVKAGVFLLVRLYPVLSGSDLYFHTVSIVGAITLLLGAWTAIFQHDLKGLLAYSTISHLGLITLLLGMSRPLAVVAALFHILNHATFKASLFMAAGIIDHETGTRDMRRLGNLRRYMPYTSALAIIASLAMAGIPLFNGFLSKEMFYAEALEISSNLPRKITVVAAFLAGVFGVAYSLRFVHDTFFGHGPRDVQREIHEPPRFMKLPVAVLVVLCVAVGIAPAMTMAPTLAVSARSVLGEDMPRYSLAIWHGFNTPLMMSLGGMLSGVALYFGLRRLFDLHAIARRSWGRHLFYVNVGALYALAQRFTYRIANGSLQRSLLLMLLAAMAMAALPALPALLGSVPGPERQPMPALGWGLWAMLVSATALTVLAHRQRLVALIVIGAVGLAVSLAFVFLSAPDLALTQLLVEMVTITLMLLALNYLPQVSPTPRAGSRRGLRRWRDALIAIAGGTGIGALAFAMMTRPTRTVADALLARSLPEAWGSNVVNVILVDFRGSDTLGEIAVFGMAGLVVHALLRHARLAPEERIPGPPVALPIPANLGHLLFPLALAVSFYLFLRGHNQPGGGFIAGLVLTVPLLLQYVLLGSRYVESRLGFDYTRMIGVGLLVALAGGIAPMLLGLPFLTSGHADLTLPLIGEVPLASAMVFDTGVYLVVFGGAMLILSMMGTIRPPKTTVKGDA